ncbi:MAG: serine kinase [Pseudomonadota bacterium]
MGAAPSIHASCVAIAGAGVLIRGPSGSGKSSLAARLILDPPRVLPEAELVADDRVVLTVRDGRVLAAPAAALAGLLEVRHLGIRRLPFLPSCPISLVVDLAAPDAERLPQEAAQTTHVAGISLCRIALGVGADAALVIAAALKTRIF